MRNGCNKNVLQLTGKQLQMGDKTTAYKQDITSGVMEMAKS